jgi:hypothetical protein
MTIGLTTGVWERGKGKREKDIFSLITFSEIKLMFLKNIKNIIHRTLGKLG